MKQTLDYSNPKLLVDTGDLNPGSLAWKSPSNIALVKYWGKHGIQLPRNPSISFTLDVAHTETHLSYAARTPGANVPIELELYFHKERNQAFEKRTIQFFESLLPVFPFLKQLKMRIDTTNSFPHSAGIASSASGMSALALCLCDLENRLFGTLSETVAFRQKASYISRLGSGSACRSVYGGSVLWGDYPAVEGSSDLYAIPVNEGLHEVFDTFHDDILLISRNEKSVSSTAGHALMEGNTYANPRYQSARQNLHHLLQAMETGDLEVFGRIVEQEALTLHALMMTSHPAYILMEPNSLTAIRRIWDFRAQTKVPLYFTLDAGPNLHLLYPDAYHQEVNQFIEDRLLELCEGQQRIADQVGEGSIAL
ncbi:MAG: diphosphomevalonate decarboxylase [Bacteroidota bacterium]